MNAIILAAGRKTQTQEKTLGKTSRSLINLEEETVLARQVRLLRKYGINDITIVVSYQKEKIMEEFSNLNFIESKHKDEKGRVSSMYSFFQSKHLWNDTLVILGDTVFSENALKQMIKTEPYEEGIVWFGSDIVGKEEEGIALKMNSKGANLIRSEMIEPFYTSLHSEKPVYYRDSGTIMCTLWWIEGKFNNKYRLIPLKDFALDTDTKEELELACELIQKDL